MKHIFAWRLHNIDNYSSFIHAIKSFPVFAQQRTSGSHLFYILTSFSSTLLFKGVLAKSTSLHFGVEMYLLVEVSCISRLHADSFSKIDLTSAYRQTQWQWQPIRSNNNKKRSLNKTGIPQFKWNFWQHSFSLTAFFLFILSEEKEVLQGIVDYTPPGCIHNTVTPQYNCMFANLHYAFIYYDNKCAWIAYINCANIILCDFPPHTRRQ